MEVENYYGPLTKRLIFTSIFQSSILMDPETEDSLKKAGVFWQISWSLGKDLAEY